jgi:hypothetical protein
MIRAAVLAIVLVAPAYASPGSRDVRLLSADQIGSCTAVGMITESRASGRNPDDAAQKALSTAMDKAAKSGANVAVIADGNSPPKQQIVVLKTYHCADGVGFNPVN